MEEFPLLPITYNTTLIENDVSSGTQIEYGPPIFSSRMTVGVVDFSELSGNLFSIFEWSELN